MKKKESGADGWKRRKLEVKKIKKFFMIFFEKYEASFSTYSIKLPASATSLLESKDELTISTNASQIEKKVKSHKSEYDKISVRLSEKT